MKWYYSEHALDSITDLQWYVGALAAHDQACGGAAFAAAATRFASSTRRASCRAPRASSPTRGGS